MADVDKVVISLLERALSSDINDLQDLNSTALLNAATSQAQEPVLDPTLALIPPRRKLVLDGLNVQGVNSTDKVTVRRGALLDFPVVSPRIALLPGPNSTDVPIPVGDGFYLVEAVVSTVTTNATRQVWVPAASAFQPQVVPIKTEYRVTLAVVTGTATTAPAPTGTGVPLAIVHRDGAGAIITPNDIIDVRPLSSDVVPCAAGSIVDARWRITTAAPTLIAVSGVDVRGGNRRFVIGPDGGLFAWADLLDASETQTVTSTYYMYMLAWEGLVPRGAYQTTNPSSQGVLVLSKKGPGQGRLVPAGIRLPQPFDGFTTVAGSPGVCFGLVFTQFVATDLSASSQRGTLVRMENVASSFFTASGPSPRTVGTAVPSGTMPINVTGVWVVFDVTSPGGVDTAVLFDGTQAFPRQPLTTISAVSLQNAAIPQATFGPGTSPDVTFAAPGAQGIVTIEGFYV